MRTLIRFLVFVLILVLLMTAGIVAVVLRPVWSALLS